MLITEVLSPSTETRDRLEKRLAYQRLPSLREYVLVAQDRLLVEIFRRSTEGWELERYEPGDSITLDSVELRLPIESLYEEVMDLPPRT